MNVRELFKNKLEYAEVTPNDSVRNELMRKMARKEFVRFNPSRFNIYYLGGIAAALIVTAVLITSGSDKSNLNQKVKANNNSSISDSISLIIPGVSQPEILPVEQKKPENNISENKSPKVAETYRNSSLITKKRTETRLDTSVIKADSLPKKSLTDNNLTIKNLTTDKPKTVEASFDVSVSGGCSPLKVKFINNSVSFESCQWQFGDGGFSSEINPQWIFDQEGEYKIVLKVSDSNGNQATSSSVITVHPRPEARFEITPEKPMLPDDNIRFLNYSADAVRFKWEFGDGTTSNEFEPDHKYAKYGNYNVRLIAWSNFGCTDSMVVKNAFAASGCYINFPNAFIPGTEGPVGGYYSTKSDESARIFHPSTSGVTEYHLKIFSKLGITIFESNDINIGWDGYFKGQLCDPGVYIWKVRGTFKNGEPFVKMGDITLLKN